MRLFCPSNNIKYKKARKDIHNFMILAYKKLTKIAKKYCLILIDEDLFAIKNELREVAKAQKITIQIVQDNNES